MVCNISALQTLRDQNQNMMQIITEALNNAKSLVSEYKCKNLVSTGVEEIPKFDNIVMVKLSHYLQFSILYKNTFTNKIISKA